MKLTDARIRTHPQFGGKIAKAEIAWCYAKLDNNQLWWIDVKTGQLNSLVEAFTDIVSDSWYIVNEESIETFKPKEKTNEQANR